MIITETMLSTLRVAVKNRVSEKRYSHILAVEKCAGDLAKLIMPENRLELCAAALLHDVTKELSAEEHTALLKSECFPLTDEDIKTAGVLHSFSAPIVIKRDFPEFATSDILSATLKHTVGGNVMSVFDRIIFISDFAEHTRRYDACVAVRDMLFVGISELSIQERIERLTEACLASISATKKSLENSSNFVNSRMLLAEKYLKSQLNIN